MPKLINIQELAALFSVDRRTIYNWLKSGKLPPPVKAWGSPRWDQEEVVKAIKGGSRATVVNFL